MLPGLIVDWYNGVAVVQAHSVGMFLSLEKISDALKEVYGKAVSYTHLSNLKPNSPTANWYSPLPAPMRR